MTLSELISQIPDFSEKNHPEKIKTFGWFLHVQRRIERFRMPDIRQCYNDSNLDLPANLGRFLDALAEKKPPELLKDSSGYRLAARVREQFDKRFGQSETVIVVEKLLSDLPGKIADEAERLFLAEALVCYRNGAFRAAIVMTWNLAYDHLLRWIMVDPVRLAQFNAGIGKRNPTKARIVVAGRDDFEELKEIEVIDIVANVPGVSGGMKKILKEKLDRRNTYAHPSILVAARSQVDDTITDLVSNVVLKLQ
jgi:hypothetical protein